MTAAEQLYWAEVNSPKSTSRSLAVCYALLIAYAAGRHKAGDPVGPEFWRPINEALNARLGLDSTRKIDRFRKVAWDINGAACDVREAA